MISSRRREIGSNRRISLNKTCLRAFEALHARRLHSGRIFQSKSGRGLRAERRLPCNAHPFECSTRYRRPDCGFGSVLTGDVIRGKMGV
jgi:hypothetical protein